MNSVIALARVRVIFRPHFSGRLDDTPIAPSYYRYDFRFSIINACSAAISSAASATPTCATGQSATAGAPSCTCAAPSPDPHRMQRPGAGRHAMHDGDHHGAGRTLDVHSYGNPGVDRLSCLRHIGDCRTRCGRTRRYRHAGACLRRCLRDCPVFARIPDRKRRSPALRT